MKNKKKGPMAQLGIMIFITMITQLFILVRASIVASNFGVSVELDAFNFANSLATLIFSFIGAGITTVLIPNLGDQEKSESVNIFISVLYTMATVVLLIILIFRTPIIGMFNIKSSEYFIHICSSISIVLLLSQYTASFIGLSNAILQYKGQFNRSKLVVLISNVLMVILLVYYTGDNIYGYAIAVLITSLVNVVLQFLLVFKTDFKFKYSINTKDKNFKKMMKSFGPIVLSTGLYQISLMIDTVIASSLGEGQISILNYSNYIVGMINMLLIVNITSFLYPKIAKEITRDDSQERLSKYITLINAALWFIVLAFFIVGDDALEILYMRGQFTVEAATVVYYCTIIYMISIPVSAIRDIIYKYFYANGNTYTPFKNSLLISVLNILFSVALAQVIGLFGVVLGTTITSIISLTLISFKFKKNFGVKFNYKEFGIENIKILFVTLVNIIIFIYLKAQFNFDNAFLNLFIYGFGTLIGYVAALFVCRSKVFKIRL